MSPFRLITLGCLALLEPEGREQSSTTTHPRKLAVLAVLAVSPQPVPRSALIEMFWGGEHEERARHSLANALSHIRRVLGKGAITTRREDVALDPVAALTVDAADVTEAARLSDWPRVLRHYGGDFLAGVYPGGSAALDHWIGRERDRLRRCFLAAASREARRLLSAGATAEAEDLSHRWLEADPLSEDAAVTLSRALLSPGARRLTTA